MYKKISHAMHVIAILTLMLSTASMLVICFNIFSGRLKSEIRSTSSILAAVLNHSDNQEKTIENLAPSLSGKVIFITDTNGKILISTKDNDSGDVSVSENFLNGISIDGQKIGFSFLDGAVTYSCAQKLDNGCTLIVSSPLHRLWGTVLTIGIPIGIMLLLIYLLSLNISMKVTENIIHPIEKSYSFNRENYDDIYEEIQPFLKRIAQQNKEIRSNMEKLKRAEKIRTEFSANVSHELKTPLTSILGYSQIINSGIARSEDIPKFTQKIEKEADRLLILIDDIIKLSDLDENSSNGMVIEKNDLLLEKIAADSIEQLSSHAARRGIAITLDGVSAPIHANRSQICELVYNLTDNAIKYNKENGSVTVTTGINDDGCSFISVSDTGIGIPEKYLDRIFERFFRVDKSHSKKINGTGLGLSIVKHIAFSNNAEINVKSELDVGTEFIVTFMKTI